jgi:hypothetical protein
MDFGGEDDPANSLLSQGLGGLGVMAFHSTRFGSAYRHVA